MRGFTAYFIRLWVFSTTGGKAGSCVHSWQWPQLKHRIDPLFARTQCSICSWEVNSKRVLGYAELARFSSPKCLLRWPTDSILFTSWLQLQLSHRIQWQKQHHQCTKAAEQICFESFCTRLSSRREATNAPGSVTAATCRVVNTLSGQHFTWRHGQSNSPKTLPSM